MTDRTRTEHDLRRWLDTTGRTPLPTDIDDLLARTARTAQRPAWSFPERWLPVNVAVQAPAVAGRRAPLRMIALAAVLVGLVAGALVVAGSQRHVAPPFGLAANGQIAFVEPVDGYGMVVDLHYRMPFGDIVLADPVTAARTVLVGGPPLDGSPVFSPDGTRLAFVREEGVGRSLYVIDVDGGDPRSLMSEPLADIRDPAWSPDGSSIAFTVPDAGLWQLWIARTDGSGLRRVEIDAAASLGLPQWRPPDGEELLVLGSNAKGLLPSYGYRGLWGGDDTLPATGVDLYRVRADGSGFVRLTHSSGHGSDYARARWGADGDTIVTQRLDSAGNLRVLTLAAADGAQRDVMAPDPGIETTYPEVSPDGRQVAFADLSPGDTWRLRIAPIDGSSAPVDVAEFLGGAASYTWSPDGRSIIVTHHFFQQTWLVDVEAHTKTLLPWVDPGDPIWQRTAD